MKELLLALFLGATNVNGYIPNSTLNEILNQPHEGVVYHKHEGDLKLIGHVKFWQIRTAINGNKAMVDGYFWRTSVTDFGTRFYGWHGVPMNGKLSFFVYQENGEWVIK